MRITPCPSLLLTVDTPSHKKTHRLSTDLCRQSQTQRAEVLSILNTHSIDSESPGADMCLASC
jgi:hypothetical protein